MKRYLASIMLSALLLAGCGAMLERVHDLHGGVGVNIVIPGQAEITQGIPAVVIVLHGEEQAAP